jgi:hypothetical protein
MIPACKYIQKKKKLFSVSVSLCKCFPSIGQQNTLWLVHLEVPPQLKASRSFSITPVSRHRNSNIGAGLVRNHPTTSALPSQTGPLDNRKTDQPIRTPCPIHQYPVGHCRRLLTMTSKLKIQTRTPHIRMRKPKTHAGHCAGSTRRQAPKKWSVVSRRNLSSRSARS